MISELPSPLVPAEVDLRDFQYMELDVRMLRDSRFAAQVSADAFRAGVLLWCACWHQVPCGSLPDDDIELAALAGYGRVVREWRKVKAEALTKFVKCSDGRIYHEEVCEKARAAWNSRLRHHYDKARDRLRKLNKQREAEKLPVFQEMSFDSWNSARVLANSSAEKSEAFVAVSAGIPPPTPTISAGIPLEKPLRGRGNGEGEGEGDLKEKTEAIASGGKPPPKPQPEVIDPAETIFAVGVPLLLAAAVPDKNARTFLGFLRKQARGKGGDKAVVDAINRCVAERALQPVEFLQGCFKTAKPDDEAAARARTTADGARLLGFGVGQETIDG